MTQTVNKALVWNRVLSCNHSSVTALSIKRFLLDNVSESLTWRIRSCIWLWEHSICRGNGTHQPKRRLKPWFGTSTPAYKTSVTPSVRLPRWEPFLAASLAHIPKCLQHARLSRKIYLRPPVTNHREAKTFIRLR